jgi:hypothetical protein
MDPAIGKKWEAWLGTDMYPDLVVARRLSTETWSFQHATADGLIRAALNWYLATQDSKVVDGISGWIPAAEREFTSLFSTFRRIKINERLLSDTVPRINDKHGQVVKLMHQVESQLLASAIHEDSNIRACPVEILQKYMVLVFRAHNIEKSYYTDSENLRTHTQRWARNQMGFRVDTDPLISTWVAAWSAATRERTQTSPERVSLFIRTVSAWDPMEAVNLTIDVKKALATDWILCYIDNELVPDPEGRELSTVLQVRCQEWCLKFLPFHLFRASFSSQASTPVLSRLGFISVKKSRGRETSGIRFKNPDTSEEVLKRAATLGKNKTKRGAAATSNTLVSDDDDTTDDTKSVGNEGVQPGPSSTCSGGGSDGDRITHVVSQHEVHLGTL